MDAVAVIRALLLAHQPVTDLVGQRIYAGDLPQDVLFPAIGLKEVSRTEFPTVANDQASALVTARVQVTAYAKPYPQQKTLVKAAKLSPGTHAGIVAGVTVRSVARGPVGPDMSNSEAGIYEQSRDFIVTYTEPN